ncbi:sensor histidine kinase [Stackebrandtia nassauensis]|uniref:histidine kinase n=1 Tax=Stackebrandtia nassauensis (strain DSM 44728 / CIP 108903 / NRRL B-16338 / NBRC 102104 / LLR-40K-21) TaxID=446470 RepID=D3PXP2_STANL|nr:histidine kinase [Stackebrandtia nassauensis]ADD43372.1 histidine kinase [Stackebrandtia nassauensis DSM 44728]
MRSEVGRRWPGWDDVLLTLVVGYMTVEEVYLRSGPLVVVEVTLAAVASLVLLWRHRWPMPSAVLAVAAAILLGAALPLVVMLFHLAYANRLITSVIAAIVAVGGNLPMDAQHSLFAPRDPGPVLLLVLPLALGMWAGGRRRLVAALEDQVTRLRTERELRAERARMAERAQIAAEMHDVLAHRLSVLALHTGALQRRAATLPEQVATRIDLLRATSTDALDDLRDMLGALRNPTRDTETAALTPVDSGLPNLLDEARAAGQTVDAVVEGDPDAAPASHRLAVLRLVQEGLTNARKHADGATARVEVHYGAPATTVRVDNDPAATGSEAGGGYGLIGLAERISALRGTIEYGHGPSGGWYLTARIPLPAHTVTAD